MKKKIFCLQLEENLKEQLKQEARDRGLSLNSYIRMLIFERNK